MFDLWRSLFARSNSRGSNCRGQGGPRFTRLRARVEGLESRQLLSVSPSVSVYAEVGQVNEPLFDHRLISVDWRPANNAAGHVVIDTSVFDAGGLQPPAGVDGEIPTEIAVVDPVIIPITGDFELTLPAHSGGKVERRRLSLPLPWNLESRPAIPADAWDPPALGGFVDIGELDSMSTPGLYTDEETTKSDAQDVEQMLSSLNYRPSMGPYESSNSFQVGERSQTGPTVPPLVAGASLANANEQPISPSAEEEPASVTAAPASNTTTVQSAEDAPEGGMVVLLQGVPIEGVTRTEAMVTPAAPPLSQSSSVQMDGAYGKYQAFEVLSAELPPGPAAVLPVEAPQSSEPLTSDAVELPAVAVEVPVIDVAAIQGGPTLTVPREESVLEELPAALPPAEAFVFSSNRLLSVAAAAIVCATAIRATRPAGDCRVDEQRMITLRRRQQAG